MKRHLQSGRLLAIASLVIVLGGCAVMPLQSNKKYVATPERDLLADAALAVETTPWPKPQSSSLVSMLTGGSEEPRLSRSDAIAIYLNDLQPVGARFGQLSIDARANLHAADRLNLVAQNALSSPRLSKNDVTALEDAIKALRENRQTYVAAAKQLEKVGEPVDEMQLDAIRDGFKYAIKDLGKTADALADEIDRDKTQTYAGPEQPDVDNYSGI